MANTFLNDVEDYYCKNGGKDPLEALVIEITNKCDHGLCAHCYASSGRDEGSFMSRESMIDMCQTLDILARGEKFAEIWLAGGEPTLHPQLDDMISLAGLMSPYVALVTNGISLSNRQFALRIAGRSALKEIAITLNSGNRYIHEMMVSQGNAPFFEKSPGIGRLSEMSEWWPVIDLYSNYAFGKAMSALINVHEARTKLGRDDLTVAINLNMSADANLAGLVWLTESEYGRIDKVIFQVMNRGAGRAKDLPDDHPLIRWTTPTVEMVNTYFSQASKLIESGRIREAVCIDPLPDEIVAELSLASNPMYQPSATPCIDVHGAFRADVVG